MIGRRQMRAWTILKLAASNSHARIGEADEIGGIRCELPSFVNFAGLITMRDFDGLCPECLNSRARSPGTTSLP